MQSKNMELTQELKDLFNTVRVKLGHPIRRIEVDDNQMCALLEICIGDYAEKVQNWIVQSNWLNFQGKNINFLQNPKDLAHSFTLQNLDFTKDYSYWFSKEVGLQSRGNYELKKDFFEIENGKQCYYIPAGREINKVLYYTPSTTKAALYGTMGGIDTGIGGGYSQLGNIGMGMGTYGFFIGSMYDVALTAADLRYKNSMFRGDLAYKVTAAGDGGHIIHLLSVPGSPNSFKGVAADDTYGWNRFAGGFVWYTYYSTEGMDGSDIEQCRIDNKNDILISPDEVPLSKMRYEYMNEPTKNTIRQLLVAEVAHTISLIRGYASGTIQIPNAQMQLDYQMFAEYGRTEKERVMNELKERLESMLPWNYIKNVSDMTDSQMNILSKKPMGMYWK